MESLDIAEPYKVTEGAIHFVRYDFALNARPSGRVLDFACGFGYGSQILSRGADVTTVTGIDINPVAVAAATANFGKPGKVDFRVVDALVDGQLESLGSFDTIISFETLEHVADPQALLRRLKAMWTGVGPFIVSIPNDPMYYGRGESLNVFHLHSYSWLEFKNWCEAILGEAEWFLGSGAYGFAVHPLTAEGKPADFVSALDISRSDLAGRVIASGKEIALTPRNALFYVAVWRSAETSVTTKPTAVIAPVSGVVSMGDHTIIPQAVRNGKRPKLLLVADIRGWAYENIARNIQEFLGSRFEVTIVYQSDFTGEWFEALRKFLFELKPSYVHYFWRETIIGLFSAPFTLSKLCTAVKMSPAEFADHLASITFTTSVYDHLHLEEDKRPVRANVFGIIDGLSVSSRRLKTIYAEAYPDVATTEIPDGLI